jgi:hypothetical protein
MTRIPLTEESELVCIASLTEVLDVLVVFWLDHALEELLAFDLHLIDEEGVR